MSNKSNENDSGYVLHTHPASFRAMPILIAAEYCQVSNLQVVVVTTPLHNENKPQPHALPILQTPRGTILFDSTAAARCMARVRSDSGLLTNNPLKVRTEIDYWIDWGTNVLETPCCVWWYPVVQYMDYHQQSHEKAKADVLAALQSLNQHFAANNNNNNKYVVTGTEAVTLADICLVCVLLYPMKLVLEPSYRESFPLVVQWFTRVVELPQFVAVLGTTVLCKKELHAAAALSQQ